MDRFLAQVLDWYVYTRFVAIRSRGVAADFHWRCGATRQCDHSNAVTGHTSLFALSVVNRAVTSNATLRPAGADRARGVPSVTGG